MTTGRARERKQERKRWGERKREREGRERDDGGKEKGRRQRGDGVIRKLEGERTGKRQTRRT